MSDHGGPRRRERWLRRVTATVSTAAGGALLVGTLVTSTDTAPDRPRDGAGLRLVAHSPGGHRWPGHPGRTLVRYRVRHGDTATGLAVRFHAWTRELRALNHLGRHARLYVGQRLRIPVVDARRADHRGRPHRSAHHRGHHRGLHRGHGAHHRSHRGHHRGHRAHHRSHRGHQRAQHHRNRQHRRHHHHPWRHAGASRGQVRRLVARSAHRHHVDRSLALAVAWQESGWQQHRISSAGAVGVMQVLPGTARWMSLYAGRPLNVYGLHDNIATGVVLLRLLRERTTVRRTIGAYYQGLGSIHRHGMYPSTRRYVRDVLALRHRLRHGWHPA